MLRNVDCLCTHCSYNNPRIVLTVHLNYLHTVSQRVVVDAFNKAIRGRGMGHRSLLSAAGGCSVAEAGLVPWQLSSGADLTHFVLPISFFRQGSISHVCHRTSPGCGIRKGSVRKWEAISVLCLTMSYLLSMSPLSFTGLSARCLMDSQGVPAWISFFINVNHIGSIFSYGRHLDDTRFDF